MSILVAGRRKWSIRLQFAWTLCAATAYDLSLTTDTAWRFGSCRYSLKDRETAGGQGDKRKWGMGWKLRPRLEHGPKGNRRENVLYCGGPRRIENAGL
jgi:hypothetical protein